jgi:phosphatidylglycerol:prolipoprotein diacylglycerol transferase
MHPLLTVLELGERQVPIGSYGVLLCLALVCVAACSLRVAHRLALDLGSAIAVLGITVLAGFVGAWALHALVQWARLGSFLRALAEPGLSVMGALAFGACALAYGARRLGLDGSRWLAHALPGLLVAFAIGRVGCLLGGCCFGAEASLPWAIHYTHPLAPAAASAIARHPVPAYEALALVMLAVAVHALPRGATALRIGVALGGYCAARFALELVRADDVRGVWASGPSTAQVMCLIAALVWPTWVWLPRVRAPATQQHAIAAKPRSGVG